MSSNTDSILSHETEALTILDRGLRDSLPGRKTDVTRRLPYLQQATSPLLLGNLVVSSLWIAPYEHSLINIQCSNVPF